MVGKKMATLVVDYHTIKNQLKYQKAKKTDYQVVIILYNKFLNKNEPINFIK